MTPERQMWWDNLPAEEKHVRQAIKRVKSDISFAKFVIKNDNMNIISRRHYRKVISHQKILLKALRKQIAMRALYERYDYHDYCFIGNCPSCDGRVEDDGYADYCPACGQKLRWK